MSRTHWTTLLLAPVLVSTAVPVPVHAAPPDDRILTVTVPPAAPDHLADLAPGDRTEWVAQVTNTGDGPVPLYATFTTSGTEALITDPGDGLQLHVELCQDPWEHATADDGPTVFACPAGTTVMGAGPAAELGILQAPAALAAGATVGLRVRMVLPVTAGNTIENTAGQLHARFATTGDDPGRPSSPVPPSVPVTTTPPDDAPGGIGEDETPAGTSLTAEDPADPDATTPGRAGTPPGAGTSAHGWPATGNGLAQTGQNLLAALVGAAVTVVAGLILLGLSRRRDRTEETSS